MDGARNVVVSGDRCLYDNEDVGEDMANPFDDMRLLVERIQKIADDLDLELVNIAFIPEESDDLYPNPRNMVSAFFGIKPEAVKSVADIEKEKLDTTFAGILEGITVEEDKEGNVILGSTSNEEEEDISEEEKRVQRQQQDAQKRLRSWIAGQDAE